ncbi:MAG TPA: peroxiredoxin [Thermodesulfobacteriota bacterium]|nr:peroxiredoxin [Thermodesulfobacteriota bacterium]
MAKMPKIGDKAPDIEAETYGGKKIKLSDYKDKKAVVLYFYPRDNTPGCTKEACSMRDGMEMLEKLGVQVLGVSTDSVKSHEGFRDKYNLNFPLLSDKSKNIIKTYGVESEHGSARRVTFLIDKSGVIRHVWEKVNTSQHAQEVAEKIKELELK